MTRSGARARPLRSTRVHAVGEADTLKGLRQSGA
jgi:hypothetical protein